MPNDHKNKGKVVFATCHAKEFPRCYIQQLACLLLIVLCKSPE